MPLSHIAQKNFLAGSNPAKNELLLDPGVGECESLLNCSTSVRVGCITALSGTSYRRSVLGAQDDTLRSLEKIIYFQKSSGANFTLASWPSGLALIDQNEVENLAFVAGLEEPITSAITDYIVYQNNLYMVNGSKYLFTFDGNTLSSKLLPSVIGNEFRPTIIEAHKGRVYFSGDINQGSTVIYSEALTPSVFRSAGGPEFINIQDDDGDYVTALVSFSDELIAFKSRRFYTLVGSPIKAVIPSLSAQVGAISNNTVQKTTFGIVFLSARGVYILNKGSLKNISKAIAPQSFSEIIKRSNIELFHSAYHKENYYLFFNDVEGTGVILDFNTLEYGLGAPAVSFLSRFNISSSVILPDINETWYATQTSTNNILTLGLNAPTYYEKSGSERLPLPSKFKSKWCDAGNEFIVKQLRVVYISFSAGIQKVKGSITYEKIGLGRKSYDFTIEEDTSVYDSAIFDQSVFGSEHTFTHKILLPAGIFCERFQLVLENVDTSRLNLNGFNFGFTIIPENL